MKNLCIQLSDKMYDELKDVARMNNTSIATILRGCFYNNLAGRSTPDLKYVDIKTDHDIKLDFSDVYLNRYELEKIGNNK